MRSRWRAGGRAARLRLPAGRGGRSGETIRGTGGETLSVPEWESPVDVAACAGPVWSGGVP
jgi:hypothetical protein